MDGLGAIDICGALAAIGMMDSRIHETVRALTAVIDELSRAKAHLHGEVAAADAEVAKTQRRLNRVLDGMPLARWRALVSERASIRTAADSRDAHLAKKRRSVVEEALVEVQAAQTSGTLRVTRAEAVLDEAVQEVERFGPLAIRLAGPVGHLDQDGTTWRAVPL